MQFLFLILIFISYSTKNATLPYETADWEAIHANCNRGSRGLLSYTCFTFKIEQTRKKLIQDVNFDVLETFNSLDCDNTGFLNQ